MASLRGSIISFCWILLVMFAVIFMVAVLFTQLVLFTIQDAHTPASAVDDLRMWFGSLGRTTLTLTEAIFSGLSWDEAIVPLIDHVSPFAGIAFSAYVLFAMLAMLNIVTGVFVGNALHCAQETEEDFLINRLCRAFHHLDSDQSGGITFDEFQGVLQTEGMLAFFEQIDVDVGESHGVFSLLDVDGSGCIDPLEFISGCLRLRGPAKAVDLAFLTWQIKQMNYNVLKCFEKLERGIGALEKGVGAIKFRRREQKSSPPGLSTVFSFDEARGAYPSEEAGVPCSDTTVDDACGHEGGMWFDYVGFEMPPMQSNMSGGPIKATIGFSDHFSAGN